MANTYIQIGSTVTVGSGGAATIDFSSIPATFTDLVVKTSLRNSVANVDVRVDFNNLTTNQSQRILRGSGSAAASGTDTNLYALTVMSTDTASTFGNGELYILNYTSANFKSFSGEYVNENNATAAFSYLIAGLWSATATINRITFTAGGSGNFVQYSTATLYGIKSS